MTDQELDALARRVLLDSVEQEPEMEEDGPVFTPSERYERSMEVMLADPAGWARERSVRKRAPQRAVVYPLIVCVETGEVYRLNDIGWPQVWTVSAQNNDWMPGPEDLTAFVKEAITWLSSRSATARYTWGVVGWYVEASVDLDAQGPLRAVCRPCVFQSIEELETIISHASSRHSTLKLSWSCGLTKKKGA